MPPFNTYNPKRTHDFKPLRLAIYFPNNIKFITIS